MSLEGCDEEQREELDALSAIYGEELRLEEEGRWSVAVREGGVEARLSFALPRDYPSLAPPRHQLSCPHLRPAQRRALTKLLEDIVADNLGQPIIYLWIEAVKDFLVDLPSPEAQSPQPKEPKPKKEAKKEPPRTPKAPEEPAEGLEEAETSEALEAVYRAPSPLASDPQCPPIESGEPFTDRKSHFQAHVAPLLERADVERVLSRLLSNGKIQRATHNIYAYRLSLEGSAHVSDCEDDGEHGAGAKMLGLLELMGCDNVIVVVSRWYGGIHLGPDRFKHINNLARAMLEAHGFCRRDNDVPKSRRKAKR